MLNRPIIVAIGPAYVSLPPAVALAMQSDCWGVDIDRGRIAELTSVRSWSL